ncbi:hypothetical protein MUK42_18864 [Musa troglodytarum]|uniref:Uncharacterized protein n=1 Tax=Musa troglodytarum TaxID=320322 RepID=A0A9E7EUL5_9LILI|nr:hypothetical protein MUK42_18864 [Musa troglodytarum]
MIGWNGPFGSGISRERDHWSYARTCSGLEVFGAKRVEFGLVLVSKKVDILAVLLGRKLFLAEEKGMWLFLASYFMEQVEDATGISYQPSTSA